MDQNGCGVKSTASVANHPLHPMVIPFPIAFLIGAFVTDIVFAMTGDPFWAQVSYWLIAAGLFMGGVAGLLGVIDFFTIPRARRSIGWIHAVGNIAVIVVAFVNIMLRNGNVTGAIEPSGLALSAISTAIIFVTGWFGGELAYRLGIGMVPIAEAREQGRGEQPLRRAA